MSVKTMSNAELFRAACKEWVEEFEMMKASREIAQRALDGDENADDYCERLCRLIEGAALNPTTASRAPH